MKMIENKKEIKSILMKFHSHHFEQLEVSCHLAKGFWKDTLFLFDDEFCVLKNDAAYLQFYTDGIDNIFIREDMPDDYLSIELKDGNIFKLIDATKAIEIAEENADKHFESFDY